MKYIFFPFTLILMIFVALIGGFAYLCDKTFGEKFLDDYLEPL